MTPLVALRPGEVGQVIGFQGGRGLSRRLAELGFTPGAPIRVVAAGRGGTDGLEPRAQVQNALFYESTGRLDKGGSARYTEIRIQYHFEGCSDA